MGISHEWNELNEMGAGSFNSFHSWLYTQPIDYVAIFVVASV